MKHSKIIYLFLALLVFASCSKKVIKIACVGDSITEGAGLACQSKTAYPVMLDSILGPNYSVLNSGRSSATLQKKGNLPYWNCKEVSNVFVYKPDMIIIQLGTNDTKKINWREETFAKDYQTLIDTLKTISSKPRIFVCLPVPAFKTQWGINDSTITASVIPTIKNIAKLNNLPVIDLHYQMRDQSKNFLDGIHPNEEGAKIMAEIISKEIKKY